MTRPVDVPPIKNPHKPNPSYSCLRVCVDCGDERWYEPRVYSRLHTPHRCHYCTATARSNHFPSQGNQH